MTPMFRALAVPNYRLWAGAALVSNTGTWMQRVAQDWLILTGLTHHDAAAVGIVSALQFGPQILLLPLAGAAADRLDRRRLLIATQAGMGLLALGLGLLVVSGTARVWQVDVFALLLGCVSAMDAPARQVFVSELVGDDLLANAVALNSASFSAGRLIGPAVAGLLIAGIGTGPVFLVNGASFLGVLGALCLLRRDRLFTERGVAKGGLIDALRYVRGRPDLVALLVMTFLIGTFGFNFAIFVSTMTASVFHAGAGRYGLLSSALACGTITAALLAARRTAPDMRLLIAACLAFGIFCALAAMAPGLWLFGLLLVPVGLASQTFNTSSSSLTQLTTARAMRGRVVALRLAVTMGGTPIGAPFVGWVANRFGPRWGLAVGAAAGLLAAAVGALHLLRRRKDGALAPLPLGHDLAP